MEWFLSSIGLESLVLTLTENASTIVKSLTEQQAENPSAGLRISSGANPSAFEIAAAAQPEPGDQVVEANGATVYLDDVASRELDDKVLDAGLDPNGAVQFALGLQG